MYILYVKSGCPFCAMVLHTVDELGLTVEERDIASAGIADELVARGGKRMVPYLVDTERSVEMYESADIVDYLQSNASAVEESV